MFVPYQVDVPMERLPLANWSLMVVIFFASLGAWIYEAAHTPPPGALFNRAADFDREVDRKVDEFVKANNRQPNDDELDAIELDVERAIGLGVGPFPFALNPARFSFLTLFTHMFVHADIFHLLGNLAFMFVFGNAVDAKLGHLYFLGLYLFGGIFAAMPYLLIGNNIPLLGASGAIFALVGAFVIYYPLNEVTAFYWFGWYINGVMELSAYWVIGFYVALDLFYAVIFTRSGVAHLAHLAGAVMGFVAASALVLTLLIPSSRGEKNFWQWMGVQEENARRKKKKKKKRRREYDDDYDD